jgi:flagellin
MGLRVQTNIESVNAQRNLGISNAATQSVTEKLASGYRINKAADDAAGLAISEKLKADIRGLNMAKRNANDGVSLLQTAEGGLNEIGNILSRLRELAVQGASDTIGNVERGFLDKEYGQLKEEIDRITNSTEYNGTRLLVGSQEDVPEILRNKSNQFPLEIQVGKDYYPEVDGLDQPTSVNTLRVDLQNIRTFTEGENSLDLGKTGNEDGTNVASKDKSQQSITKIDDAISRVASHRSYLGAIQNRLGSTIANLAIQSENFSAANSRIRDADYAEESSNLAKYNILKQAGTSVLAQSNQSTASVLNLLG